MTTETTNGSPPAAALKQIAEPARSKRIDPETVTPRDMLRAEAMLADYDDSGLPVPLPSREPYGLMRHGIHRVALTAWCVRSREDPSFTYGDALDVPYGEHNDDDEDEEPDPQTPPADGAKPSSSGQSGTGRARRGARTSG
jgi:hypothetical protein